VISFIFILLLQWLRVTRVCHGREVFSEVGHIQLWSFAARDYYGQKEQWSIWQQLIQFKFTV